MVQPEECSKAPGDVREREVAKGGMDLINFNNRQGECRVQSQTGDIQRRIGPQHRWASSCRAVWSYLKDCFQDCWSASEDVFEGLSDRLWQSLVSIAVAHRHSKSKDQLRISLYRKARDENGEPPERGPARAVEQVAVKVGQSV